MTKEQEEAIKRCEKLIEVQNANWIGISNQSAIKNVLNMLKEKDKLYHKALGDLVKADRENIQLKKQIDLMAERIEWLCKSNGILLDKEHDENFTQEDIKKYFKQKAIEMLQEGE